MFKNLAAEMMGMGDIGTIVEPQDFNKTDVDDYIFHEDNEKIFFVIKSAADEYCFTNVAFIHLDGKSAMSKKRTLNRYLYKHHSIKNVLLETAGGVDLDAEIKFQLGDQHFSIDIDKKQIEKIRDLYKALFTIGETLKEINRKRNILLQSNESVQKMFNLRELNEQAILNLPAIINQTAHQVEDYTRQRLIEIENFDFSEIFERYLKN
ncbi:PH domain-containing protein [uncultured Acinetobacter sp.]|uniref:PH domain-containing protein n=1 Tax=uncultured Acinetobacter sp. TaxID=165433 RepID=UPI0025CC7953|nr:PH domain-containing protein [uncultured Acinetobacter sp.]